MARLDALRENPASDGGTAIALSETPNSGNTRLRGDNAMLLVLLILLAALSLMPIGDDNQGRTITPYVTYTLIAINIVVFLFFQGAGANPRFTYGFSVVPYEILHGVDLVGTRGNIPQAPGPSPIYLTILSAMFMHGSWMHIFGNMLYLWIFGDNVEDALGHAKFLIFYLLCGLAATAAHVFFDQNSTVPSLGASGAIAGVLGGYLLMYPGRRVRVLMGIGIVTVVQLPALIVIGFWAVLQFFNGLGSIARTEQTTGGVAYMAHVGGFVAGLLLVSLFRNRATPFHAPDRTDYTSWR
jgi:membrane associated rhomboid family serine protease